MEDIKGQPWYFGTISRAECDVLLTEKGMDGDFMIRESETNVSFINFSCVYEVAFEFHEIFAAIYYVKV